MGFHGYLRWLHLPALCLVLLTGVACGGSEPAAKGPNAYEQNAKRAYDKAMEAYFDKNWILAVQLLEEVRRDFGYTRYARLAELRLADAAFRQEKFPEAVTAYKNFVHDYPNDEEVPYARYRITRAQFMQSSAGLLLPPLEERDLAAVQDAYASLRAFLGDYPNYKKGIELRYMLEVVTGLLARHELYVARFYLNRDEFEAAVARTEYALLNYPDSGLNPEAKVLLGETYLKMHQYDRARTLFESVQDKHPESAFSLVAGNFLEHIEQNGLRGMPPEEQPEEAAPPPQALPATQQARPKANPAPK